LSGRNLAFVIRTNQISIYIKVLCIVLLFAVLLKWIHRILKQGNALYQTELNIYRSHGTSPLEILLCDIALNSYPIIIRSIPTTVYSRVGRFFYWYFLFGAFYFLLASPPSVN